MSNQDKPAFPHKPEIRRQVTEDIFTVEHGDTPGMSLREYAAIKLRVPDSGTDWLDAMIEKSLLSEFAGKALNGMLAHSTRYKPAYGYPHNWHAAISQEAFEIAEQMIYHSKGE